MSEEKREFKRLTAFKMNLNNVVNAKYVPVEGGADYIEVKDLKVSRVRIMGTIVSKTIAEDRSYGFLTIDDGTQTISISSSKNFNTGETNIEQLEKPIIGNIVEIIGRINEWEGKRKINAEIVKIIKDPNHWLYHKYELLLSNEKVERIIEKKEKTISTSVETNKDEKINQEDVILNIVKENDIGKGTSMSLIQKLSKLDAEEVKNVLKTLLMDGLIYEPTKLNYKILDV